MSSENQVLNSIHGIRYLSDKSQTLSIRLFWAIAFVCSIGGMTFYAYNISVKFNFEPSIVELVRLKNIREVPLPALTLCSPLMATTDYAPYGDFLKAVKNNQSLTKFSSNDQKKLAALSHACYKSKNNDESFCIEENVEETVKYLEEASSPTHQAITSVMTYRSLTPDTIFNRVLTDHGFCYSFNMLGYHSIFKKSTISSDFDSYIRKGIKAGPKPLKDEFEEIEWTPATGYLTLDHHAFPRRIRKGYNDDMTITLHINQSDVVNLCPVMRDSYKLSLHQPHEMSTEFHEHLFLGLRSNHIVTMTANIRSTDYSLLRYSPEKRGCYKNNEKKLEFFNSYTKWHCVLECYANYTLKICGCKKFSMPRLPDTPICGLHQRKCLASVLKKWTESDEFGDESTILCNCLPNCHRINYGVKMISHVDYEGKDENSEDDVITKIEIIFEDFLVEERMAVVSYKLANFVADLGGLLGLFLGCSLLSVVELIYFCIKVCVKRRRQRVEKITISHKNLTQQGEEFLKTLNLINADVEMPPGLIYLP